MKGLGTHLSYFKRNMNGKCNLINNRDSNMVLGTAIKGKDIKYHKK